MLIASMSNFYGAVYFNLELLINYYCFKKTTLFYTVTDPLSCCTTVALQSYEGTLVLVITAHSKVLRTLQS